MKEQLVQAKRLSTLGEIAVEVTHKIKNSLVSIGGFAHRLKDKMTYLAQKWKDSDDLKSCSKQFDLFQTWSTRNRRMPAQQVYRKSPLSIQDRLYEKNINLVTRLEADLPSLNLDQQKKITVRVEYTSGGIPQKVLENIFNPFFTTKHNGTGLGLSICRKIIENHGGTIRVENQLDKGLTVYLHLPLQNSPD